MKRSVLRLFVALLVGSMMGAAMAQESTPRARDLGVPFRGKPGPLNAITDVAGIEVGHTTIIEGEGKLVRGKGPVRTGVTAILPRGKQSTDPVFGAWFTLNAAGEMTGTTYLEERGLLEGPILITNTHSVGVVRDAAVEWMVNKGWPESWHVPVAAETYDGTLNDTNGFHVTKQHALAALDHASSGPVQEGAVGGGTGMICNRFKGGIGTSSRKVEVQGQSYTVGVLVQCNYGARSELRQIASVPVPELQRSWSPCYVNSEWRPENAPFPVCTKDQASLETGKGPDGSIIIVIATDAPLLPNQLKRLAKRPSLGLGWLGAVSSPGSGDIFIAFSTAFNGALREDKISDGLSMYPNNALAILFNAVEEATEESIVNAMVAARTMIGANGVKVFELPKDELRRIMQKHAASASVPIQK